MAATKHSKAVLGILVAAIAAAGLAVDVKDVPDLTREQLDALAAALGIPSADIAAAKTKADLVDAINAAAKAKADADAEAKKAAAAAKPKVQTVKMVRDAEVHPEGPHSANVHPDEVANWKALGWKLAK